MSYIIVHRWCADGNHKKILIPLAHISWIEKAEDLSKVCFGASPCFEPEEMLVAESFDDIQHQINKQS